MASYRRSEDLINLGAYAAGSNPVLDAAIRTRPQLEAFLKQDSELKVSREETLHSLERLAGAL